MGPFRDPALFAEHVAPHDLRLMKLIDATCRFNILHVCDYEGPYADLAPLLRYPGHVVSCSPRLTTGEVPLRELARRFGRPIMGGLDRKGTIATGTDEEIRHAVEGVQFHPESILTRCGHDQLQNFINTTRRQRMDRS